MSAHTPGPWRVVKRANGAGISMLAVDTNTQVGGSWRPFKSSKIITSQNVADAGLIATAPEMLALLQSLILQEDRRALSLGALSTTVRAVVSKATGGKP